MNIYDEQGQGAKVNTYAWRVSWGSNLCEDSTTTPKADPPPPRRAQKRSEFWHSFAVRYTPSGVTTLNWTFSKLVISYWLPIDRLRIAQQNSPLDQHRDRRQGLKCYGHRPICPKFKGRWYYMPGRSYQDPTGSNSLMVTTNPSNIVLVREMINIFREDTTLFRNSSGWFMMMRHMHHSRQKWWLGTSFGRSTSQVRKPHRTPTVEMLLRLDE